MIVYDGINNGNNRHWHVSRGIPVALIISLTLMIVAQTATGAWWVASVDKRLEDVERAQALMAPQAERLARLEEKVVSVQVGINRIENLLTKPIAR